jgi:hypothetical protein
MSVQKTKTSWRMMISSGTHRSTLIENQISTFLARLFEEKKSCYCRHSGVSVCISVSVWVDKFSVKFSQKLSKVSIWNLEYLFTIKRGTNYNKADDPVICISNKMLGGVVFSCQQIGVNTFYKCIEFQVNSFDSYWEILIILKDLEFLRRIQFLNNYEIMIGSEMKLDIPVHYQMA